MVTKKIKQRCFSHSLGRYIVLGNGEYQQICNLKGNFATDKNLSKVTLLLMREFETESN